MYVNRYRVYIKQSKSMSRNTAPQYCIISIHSKDKLLFNRLVIINSPASKRTFLRKNFTSLTVKSYYEKTESSTKLYHNS